MRSLVPSPAWSTDPPDSQGEMRLGRGSRLSQRRFRAGAWVLLALTCWSLSATASGLAGDDLPTPRGTPPAPAPPTIVIGFVGGFVHRDDARHAEVQLVRKLQVAHQNRVRAEVFQNRQREKARRAIMAWLDTDHDGTLSEDEKRAARIVLYGHSWGGSAALVLAQELERDHIPVLLTVQVDSIARRGQDDGVVPSNVEKAINFYQTKGLLRGRKKIAAADPSRTRVLGDYRFEYEKPPAECSAYPWYDRYFFRGHTAIECDPAVWSRIEALIETYLPGGAVTNPIQETIR